MEQHYYFSKKLRCDKRHELLFEYTSRITSLHGRASKINHSTDLPRRYGTHVKNFKQTAFNNAVDFNVNVIC